ncbi:MAG: L-aspartate oxidase [Candidatus Peregrinibacteria bacterium GW2011_GWA2_33_10]|nr:MAG: L-aspartate oxidase [Candidatus Peregrinibacteria bacterium GW2011_GWA2_33_10]KKP38244.1 MAG: L-aspartate oxidase, L-aspartate oxidase [Candidatus Peregrinibacteria bacterium GW2011_GWC2_33_13]OGJ49794.1 MAG: L-aspartate oxidase [Candidatus Peregrinibacteria bacterium RIFOXYA2_FULL_33_7]
MSNPDYLIIGSGIAGLNFALNAAKHGKVLIVTKKNTVTTNTNLAQGGIAAVLSKLDDFQKHIKDTLEAGARHNNTKAVEFLIKNGPEAIYKLAKIGVPFSTDNQGKLLLTKEGGHSERRIAFVGDYTGAAIEKTLMEKTAKNPNIDVLEHTMAFELLCKNKKCFGIKVMNNKTIKNIFAKNTIMATGGIGQLYRVTTNPPISTGDGIAMAYKAGCEVQDLEFIQFHPTALNVKQKPHFLLSEALRGEGALLLNHKKMRFMQNYHQLAELAPRDIVSRAVFFESQKGPIYLDLRHKDKHEIIARFPKIYKTLKKYKLDLTKDLIPISPAAHYLCGGIKVNLKGETNIKNLFAFGETAATGVHGANRLASNSLLEALVFSEQIIKSSKTEKIKDPEILKIKKHFSQKKQQYQKNDPKLNKILTNIKKSLRDLMWKNVGIIRNMSKLKKTLKKIETLESKIPPNKFTNEKIAELENMLLTSKLIVSSSLKRKKSLGCHYIE